MKLSNDKIRESVIKFFEKREITLPKVPLEELDQKNFVEEGWLDSLGIVNFISFIEDEFEVEISAEEMSDESFLSFCGVIRALRQK